MGEGECGWVGDAVSKAMIRGTDFSMALQTAGYNPISELGESAE